MPIPTANLLNQDFGRLTVLEFSGYRARGKKQIIRQAAWLCRCKCGTERIFQASQLISGGSRSCGCAGRDKAAQNARLLGHKNAKNGGSTAARQLYANYKNGAKKRGLAFDISFDQAIALYSSNCTYCGIEPRQINYVRTMDSSFVYNGIDRVDNDKGYIDGNCVACCKRCNETKSNYTYDDFKDWIRRVYEITHGGRNASL